MALSEKTLAKLGRLMDRGNPDPEPMTDMEIVMYGYGPIQRVGSLDLAHGTTVRLVDPEHNGAFSIGYGGWFLAAPCGRDGYVRNVSRLTGSGIQRYDIPLPEYLQWVSFGSPKNYFDAGYFASYRVF